MRVKIVGWSVAGALVLGAAAFTAPATTASAADAAANGAQVRSAAAAEGRYELVWRDEFKGEKLSDERWAQLPTGASSGRTCASNSAGMTKLEDGIAQLSATVDPSRAGDATCPTYFFNSQVGTKQTFTYGKFSARIKFQEPEGMHAAFWLLPVRGVPAAGVPASDLPGSQGAEIDVAEYFGDDFAKGDGKKAGIYSYVYWPKQNPDGSVSSVKTGGLQDETFEVIGENQRPSDGYHVYSVEWTPKEYVFRVDGVKVDTIEVGVSHRPEHIRLSMLTSDWEVPAIKKKELPGTMKVDWVRVHQKK